MAESAGDNNGFIESQAILGMDNVQLRLPVASIGNRVLAAFLDHLVLVALAVTLMIVMLGLMVAETDSAAVTAVIGIFGIFVLNWGYFAASEILFGGQTLGKRIVKLRVVSRDGGTASAAALILRNLLRPIDNFVGLVLIALDPMARRLGDRLGGTLVVRESGPRAATVLGRVPAAWGAREVALVEAFLARDATLEAHHRVELAHRILAWIRRDDPAFLDGIEEHEDPCVMVRLAFRPDQL